MTAVFDTLERHGVREQQAIRLASAQSRAASELPAVHSFRQQVLALDGDTFAADFPAPRLVSASLKCSSSVLRDYVLWWIAHPDRESDFATRTRWARWLPASMLIRAMRWLGYDGIIYLRGDDILGHVYFQRRGTSMYAFSAAVNPDLRGKGYAVMMLLDFLAYASQLPGVTQARVGRGHSEYNSRLLARIKARETQFGWDVGSDGWVKFQRQNSAELKRCA